MTLGTVKRLYSILVMLVKTGCLFALTCQMHGPWHCKTALLMLAMPVKAGCLFALIWRIRSPWHYSMALFNISCASPDWISLYTHFVLTLHLTLHIHGPRYCKIAGFNISSACQDRMSLYTHFSPVTLFTVFMALPCHGIRPHAGLSEFFKKKKNKSWPLVQSNLYNSILYNSITSLLASTGPVPTWDYDNNSIPL